MNHVGLSNDVKNQMFSAIIYINHLILGNLQDVFVTTSINLGKFSSWNEVCGSLYILHKST